MQHAASVGSGSAKVARSNIFPGSSSFTPRIARSDGGAWTIWDTPGPVQSHIQGLGGVYLLVAVGCDFGVDVGLYDGRVFGGLGSLLESSCMG